MASRLLAADLHIHADLLEIFPVALLFHVAILAFCLLSLRVSWHLAHEYGDERAGEKQTAFHRSLLVKK
jgi:hypothetical protein